MIRKRFALFGILAIAAMSTACAPTDATISTTVKTKLAADETVKVAQIDVSVQQRVVTLTGTVDDQTIKERAVAVARAIDGVAGIVDQLTVQQPGHGPNHGRHGPGMEGERRATQ